MEAYVYWHVRIYAEHIIEKDRLNYSLEEYRGKGRGKELTEQRAYLIARLLNVGFWNKHLSQFFKRKPSTITGLVKGMRRGRNEVQGDY